MVTTANPERDERLLDESIEETFPASDPTSSARPGSILGMRYPIAPRPGRAGRTKLQPWLLGALLGGAALAVLAASRRRR